MGTKASCDYYWLHHQKRGEQICLTTNQQIKHKDGLSDLGGNKIRHCLLTQE